MQGEERVAQSAPVNPEDVLAEKVAEMYLRGAPLKKIKEEFGLPASTIYRLLRKKGVKLRRGSYETKGKLSPEDLAYIRRLYVEECLTVYRIARMIDRRPSTVYMALKRMGVLDKRRCSGYSEAVEEEENKNV